MAVTVSKSKRGERETRVVKTKSGNGTRAPQSYNWWRAKSKEQLANQVIDTAAFLKEQQQYRFRQASIFARMYGNIPLSSIAGSSLNKLNTNNQLPIDRPTMNVVQSCADTLTSRISQARPRPLFLTDNGDYKQRELAKKLNNFIAGELYQTKAYDLAQTLLRDAAILGDGVVKILERDDKVVLERVLPTEIYVDNNDAFYGKPRSMYQLKLIDRSVLKDIHPEERSRIEQAEQAYPDASGDSQKTASDQVMLVEAWHLPSGKDADDGRHVIACTSGTILDEPFDADDYPFVILPYSPRLVGMWAQGLAEQLMGTQVEINKLLMTISKSISIVGVPRVFVEDGSKVVKSHLNNEIGAIVTYRGTKPDYEVAPCVPQEMYAQLQRLVEYAYQQSGISALAATSQKPAGLNSGEAIRNYDDLQSDRFAVLNKRYNNFFIELSYKIFDKACEIAEREGKYQTIYPNKDGSKEIDLPKEAMNAKNPFIIQCFDSSSLPKDPAGRVQKVTELMQAGIIDPEEGRRLLDFPDLQQDEKLKFAAKERIFKQLDEIVEHGTYEGPDPYTDIAQGKIIVVQYYNLYAASGLPEKKLQQLRDWQSQLLNLEQAAMASMAPPPMAVGANNAAGPQAVPEAAPVSNLMSQVPA